MWSSLLRLAVLAVLPQVIVADSNGMDMTMDGPMDLVMGAMKPYLHFTTGDMLWFMGWTTVSKGSLAGACIGLFLLAIVDRWIAACRSLMEVHWRKRAQTLIANKCNAAGPAALSTAPTFATEKDKELNVDISLAEALPSLPEKYPVQRSLVQTLRSIPPFIPSHDIPRGIIHATQALLAYAFMLAAMTFQASFVISISIGLGVGEMLFGRYMAYARL